MSFLSWLKRVLIFSFCFLLTIGCQNIKTRPSEKSQPKAEIVNESPTVAESTNSFENAEDSNAGSSHSVESELPEVLVEQTPMKKTPKIGLILGPGGAKAIAHLGILQELQNRKVPIHAIAGVEWGAFIGSLYAYRGSLNDVQWFVNKLKPEDVLQKNFITRAQEPASGDKMNLFLGEAFGGTLTEKTRIPFFCPAYMLSRSETFIMSRSFLKDAVSYCLPMPPLMRDYRGYVAQPTDIALVAQNLRARGANYIIYVSVMGPGGVKASNLDTSSAILWHFADQKALARHKIDASLSIRLNEYSIYDYDKSREMVQKAATMSQTVLDKLLRPMGL